MWAAIVRFFSWLFGRGTPPGNTNSGAKPTTDELMLAYNRIDTMCQSRDFVAAQNERLLLYSQYGQPLDIKIHDVLSEFFLQEESYDLALQEVNNELQLTQDVNAQLRKVLILLESGQPAQAQTFFNAMSPAQTALKSNPRVATRLGRVYRDLWEANGRVDATVLQQAIDAYQLAATTLPTDYFPAVNLAELTLLQHIIVNKQLAAAALTATQPLFQDVVQRCNTASANGDQSYWLPFSLGEAHIGLDAAAAARLDYQRGADMQPYPRDKRSVLAGAHRILTAIGDKSGLEATINGYLFPPPQS